MPLEAIVFQYSRPPTPRLLLASLQRKPQSSTELAHRVQRPVGIVWRMLQVLRAAGKVQLRDDKWWPLEVQS